MKKYWLQFFTLLLALCLLTGCQSQAEKQPEIQSLQQLNAVTEEQLRTRSLTLYVPQNAFSSVSTVSTYVRLLPYESPAEAAVKELFYRVGQQEDSGTVSLISIACTDQTAIVNLTGSPEDYTDQQRFVLAYCITNTLCEIGGITYVNILINDRAMAYNGIAYGALTQFDQDVDTALWQFSSASEKAQEPTALYSKKATLYFGSPDGDYLIAEPQELTLVGGQEMLGGVIAALAKGSMSASCVRLLPTTAYLSSYELTQDPATGAQQIDIRLEGSIYAYLTRNNLSESLAAASVSMTLFDFYPNLASVTVSFDRRTDRPITMRRVDQELHIGTTLELYYPCSDGGIVQAKRVISTFESASVECIFELMFDPPDYLSDQHIESVFPEGLDQSDVLSVSISNETAGINVTSRFVQTLRALDASKERDVLYSIVNTLCKSKGVNRVTFLQDGLTCVSVPGRIHLSAVLYYNPGIVR